MRYLRALPGAVMTNSTKSKTSSTTGDSKASERHCESKLRALAKKIASDCDEVGADHPWPDEPMLHNRPCERCSSFGDCYVIEAIDALESPTEGQEE